MSKTEVVVYANQDILAAAAAARLVTRLVDVQAAKGSASLVLTGGGTGIARQKPVAVAQGRGLGPGCGEGDIEGAWLYPFVQHQVDEQVVGIGHASAGCRAAMAGPCTSSCRVLFCMPAHQNAGSRWSMR